jgi:hypothetical protein
VAHRTFVRVKNFAPGVLSDVAGIGAASYC